MKLLEPLSLGPRTAPNRVMFGPHETNLARGRALSEHHVAYYLERAKGGCGTIVVEQATVHDSDWPYERCPRAEDADWRSIAEACRPHGALVIVALGHSGGQGSAAFHQRPLWAPSDEPEVNTREVPKIMETEDIEEVVAGFVSAATLAAESGVDGVEINAGQHSLIRQFLSGLTNRRDDAYGADRLRFAREVLAATRSGLGTDRVLGLRLSCDELAPWAGITPEEAVGIARTLAPLVDYLVVVRGSIFTVDETRPTLHHPPGFNLELARSIHGAVDGEAAVFAQGSIVDHDQAEWAVTDGCSDGVEMTRAQIAEPRLVEKLGVPDQIRPCVLCNQKCKVRDNRNPIVGCIVNPRAGHELAERDPDAFWSSADDRDEGDRAVPGGRRVLVVGGGPAGLEAARVAGAAGIEVRLIERSPRLGGAALVAATTPAQDRFRLFVDWLERQCRASGAEIELDTEATPELLESWEGPVILATGGRATAPPFPVVEGANVISVVEALEELASDEVPNPPVMVWDPIGGPTGVAVAEALARRQIDVSLCTPDGIAGNLLALSGDLAGSNVRLQQAGVDLHRRTSISSFDGRQVVSEHVLTGERSTIPVATVIDAGHRVPDDRLWQGAGGIRVGDVVAPRTVAEAVREGRQAALQLEEAALRLEENV